MEFKKVEGHSDLVRDMGSGAIINNDRTAYQSYIQLREQKLKERERLEKVESEITEIKSLLHKLLDKL